jgi:ElaB/YqjD/DUF883 family membrane-anchored ribosome-binding protein
MSTSSQRLVKDLKTVARDAENLLEATVGDVSERAKEARSRLSAALESAKESCGRLQEKALEGAKATDQVIRGHPYESIGIAFGVGLLVGVLATRRIHG